MANASNDHHNSGRKACTFKATYTADRYSISSKDKSSRLSSITTNTATDVTIKMKNQDEQALIKVQTRTTSKKWMAEQRTPIPSVSDKAVAKKCLDKELPVAFSPKYNTHNLMYEKFAKRYPSKD
ncbi:hypothetical protein T02_11043 [Trichinella nativa]|uniref:Uncharacterized protein n=1 Tax=Trichinella nativa TaxID=6335 RepID=A0A0V1LTS4_9BILA|nr:hypothetical protein T02_11043 [Trichinella nativa]